MWNLIPRKLMPPTRLVRYCCSILKETGGKGRFIATGVRWDESTKRKSRGQMEIITSKVDKKITLNNDNEEDRRLFESCQMKGKRVVNPIIDWTTEDVLAFVESEHIHLNPLYECGFSRVGCIGCPMAGKKTREHEFELFPKYKTAYINAFQKMMERRQNLGKTANGMRWGVDGMDVFNWWMENDVLPGQEYMPGFEEV